VERDIAARCPRYLTRVQPRLSVFAFQSTRNSAARRASTSSYQLRQGWQAQPQGDL
jgi:hypothetical protein